MASPVSAQCVQWMGGGGNCDSEGIVEEKHTKVCFQTVSRSFNVCTERKALEQRMQALQRGKANTQLLQRRERREEEAQGKK